MKICYFDAFSGISGDMTVGALVDAGAGGDALIQALNSLSTGASCRLEKTRRRGIAATRFIVEGGETRKHRHLHHILDLIGASALTARARGYAEAIFRRLAEAEAAVHGIPVEKVHFHEVGAADSIADICGAAVALDLLDVGRVAASAINVGSGTVEAEHGSLPVPAPAAARLLEGKPVYARGPAVELTTPTGAAIVSTLAESFGPLPPMRLLATGLGAGARDFAEHANVLRVMIGEDEQAAEATTISVIEANIDDSTAEVLGYAVEALLEAGALDVTLQPIAMKKNRPGSLIRVLARPEDRERLAELLFRETSTFGIRLWTAERRVQPRRFVTVETRFGPVRVKVASSGAFAPEYEDCRRLARASGAPLREILAEASHQYLNQ